jgi:putative phosphoribosyl transferase
MLSLAHALPNKNQAISSARSKGAKQVVVAVPVGARDSLEEIAEQVDAVVCPLQPAPGTFGGVGRFYEVFGQTQDEVIKLAANEANE